ncbi:ATPase, T2SS/T4P/T4SS family [Bdellovibrionota bacterium FG-1]
MPHTNSTPPWLLTLLQRPEVTDICINGTEEVYLDQGDGMVRLEHKPLWNHETEMHQWVLHHVAAAGKTWDARYPFIDATLLSGHRLHVAFPPLARPGILISLRRLAQPRIESRWKNSPYYEVLCQAVRRGESILVAGATGSGKTTLVNDLLGEIPSHQRILALEDTPELWPAHPHFISLNSRPPNADGFGEVTLRTLLKQALRMRPDRVILGECRGAEVLDLLQALNTGHPGAMTTVHANSPRDALRRIELLCLLAAGTAIPLSAIRELLACGIQWLVQVGRVASQNGQPRREILEIGRVEGREGDTILIRPLMK